MPVAVAVPVAGGLMVLVVVVLAVVVVVLVVVVVVVGPSVIDSLHVLFVGMYPLRHMHWKPSIMFSQCRHAVHVLLAAVVDEFAVARSRIVLIAVDAAA